MTTVYIDGFESVNDVDDFIDSGPVQMGLGFVYSAFTTGVLSNRGIEIDEDWGVIVPDNSEYYVGFRFYDESYSTTVYEFPLVSFHHPYESFSNPQVVIYRNVFGELKVTRNTGSTNVLGRTDPGVLRARVNHYVEIRVVVHDSTGIVEIKIDGEEVLNLTGLDTQATTFGSEIGAIAFGEGSSSTTQSIDDLYINNTTGSAPNNGYMGDIDIRALVPNGAGFQTDFTASAGNNYQAVDETFPDDDTTYVESSTNGNIDSYAYSNLPVSYDTIPVIRVRTRAKKAENEPGPKDFRSRVRSSASDALGDDERLLEYYTGFNQYLETDPNGGGAWTAAAINAIEAGFEVRS